MITKAEWQAADKLILRMPLRSVGPSSLLCIVMLLDVAISLYSLVMISTVCLLFHQTDSASSACSIRLIVLLIIVWCGDDRSATGVSAVMETAVMNQSPTWWCIMAPFCIHTLCEVMTLSCAHTAIDVIHVIELAVSVSLNVSWWKSPDVFCAYHALPPVANLTTINLLSVAMSSEGEDADSAKRFQGSIFGCVINLQTLLSNRDRQTSPLHYHAQHQLCMPFTTLTFCSTLFCFSPWVGRARSGCLFPIASSAIIYDSVVMWWAWCIRLLSHILLFDSILCLTFIDRYISYHLLLILHKHVYHQRYTE